MMTSFRHVALLLASSLALSAAASAQDPVGVWNTKMNFNGNVREATLTITKGSSGLAGTWTSQRGESELSDVVFEAGKLSFLRRVNFNGQNMELAFEGKIDGDKLSGALVSDLGEMEISGTRAAASTDSEAAKALVGTWNGSTTVVGGKSEWQMIVSDDLKVVIESEGASMAVSSLKLAGDKLSFLLAVAPKEGKKVELAFAGKLGEASFKGRLSLPGLGEIAELSASKAAAVDMSAMVGKWKLVSESERGRRESSMVIKADMTGTVNFGEFGNFALDYVELVGDSLGWGINADFGGQQVYIEFDGKLEGNRFSGSLWAGDMEVANMTGTKQE